MKCGVCRREGLRSTTLVYVSAGGGIVERVRACAKCMGETVTIAIGQKPAPACKCGKPAERCAACIDKRAARERASGVEEVSKTLRRRAKAYRHAAEHDAAGASSFARAHQEGLAEGLEMAATLLDSGRWSP